MHRWLILFVGLLAFTRSFGQVEPDSVETPVRQTNPPRPSLLENLFAGGNFSLAFGSESLIEISPLAGIKITEKLGAGLGFTYIYYSYNIRPYEYSTSIYGGRIFARYLIFENLFAHAEYENLFFENLNSPGNEILVESTLVGAGLRQSLGGNFHSNLLVLYNVMHEPGVSVYGSPIVMRVGFTVGF